MDWTLQHVAKCSPIARHDLLSDAREVRVVPLDRRGSERLSGALERLRDMGCVTIDARVIQWTGRAKPVRSIGIHATKRIAAISGENAQIREAMTSAELKHQQRQRDDALAAVRRRHETNLAMRSERAARFRRRPMAVSDGIRTLLQQIVLTGPARHLKEQMDYASKITSDP